MDIILGKFLQAAPEAGPPKMAEIPPEVQARLGEAKNVDEASIDELKAILKDYYDRWVKQDINQVGADDCLNVHAPRGLRHLVSIPRISYTSLYISDLMASWLY